MLTYLFGPNVSLSNTSIETASPCSGAVTSSHWKLCISVKQVSEHVHILNHDFFKTSTQHYLATSLVDVYSDKYMLLKLEGLSVTANSVFHLNVIYFKLEYLGLNEQSQFVALGSLARLYCQCQIV